MCNSGIHQSINGVIDPFSFSTLHFLRTCNRLMLPTDLRPYYNIENNTEKVYDFTSIDSNSDNSTLKRHSGFKKSSSEVPHRQENGAISPVLSPTANPSYQKDVGSATPTGATPSSLSTLLTPGNSSCSSLGFDYTTLPGGEYHPALRVHGASSNSSASHFSDISYSNLLNRRQRGEKRPIPEEQKDEKYYERRKRNNEAAKKSRDARKMREDRVAFRAAILEQENAILRAQLIALREEMTTLRQMMGTRPPAQISVNL